MVGALLVYWVGFTLFDYFGSKSNPRESLEFLKWVFLGPALVLGVLYALAALLWVKDHLVLWWLRLRYPDAYRQAVEDFEKSPNRWRYG